MIRVSVITINLNNRIGLKKTLDSVLNQSFKNYEIILIDGGSTDGSIELIDAYKSKLTYFVSEKDNGIYSAMNKGIRKSSGQYCFFLNSGDYLVNNNVFSNVFKGQLNTDIIYGNLLVGKKDKIQSKIQGKKIITFMDLYLSDTIKHQSSFINKNLLLKYNLYSEKLSIVADWEFYIKSVGFGKASYTYLDIDIAYFDNDGLSNNSTEIVKKERESVLEEQIPKIFLEDYKTFEKYNLYKHAILCKLMTLPLRILNKIAKKLN